MRDALAEQIHPLIRNVLNLHDAWQNAEMPSFEVGHQQILERMNRLIAAFPAPRFPNLQQQTAVERDLLGGGSDTTAMPATLGVAYPLACWIDELFTLHSPMAARWNERKLEVLLYGTNDRAWQFWRQAELAAEQPEADLLEVAYVCVALGFRGEMIEDDAQLKTWLTRSRDRLLTQFQRNWVPPASANVPTAAPPLLGFKQVQRMGLILGIAVAILIPVATWLAFRQITK